MTHIHEVTFEDGMPVISETSRQVLLMRGFNETQIKSALDTISREVIKKAVQPVMSSDHQPCVQCGGIEFIRTGTCFACQTCGTSQGCS